METGEFSVAESFSADGYILNIIRRAVNHSQNVMIEGPNQGRITILSKDGEYFADVDDMAFFCREPASQFRVSVFKDSKVKEYKTGIGRNLDELTWMAGFYASQGRLVKGCNWDDVIELSHWPNFTRLPMTPNTLRMASLMSKHTTSIEHTILVLKLKREEAYQFYTAAYCAGAVRAVNRKDARPVLRPHRNSALLSMLLDKIAHI
jgi:hypothetical protein